MRVSVCVRAKCLAYVNGPIREEIECMLGVLVFDFFL